MNCDGARDRIILAVYGELPDEDAIGLEQHLSACPDCMEELESMQMMDGNLALYPMADPDPNLLAASRMRLEEALDAMPQHGFLTRLRANGRRLAGSPAGCAGPGDSAAGRWISGRQLYVSLPGGACAQARASGDFDQCVGRRCGQCFEHLAATGRPRAGQLQPRRAGDGAGLARRPSDSSVADGGDAGPASTMACEWIRFRCWRMSAS